MNHPLLQRKARHAHHTAHLRRDLGGPPGARPARAILEPRGRGGLRAAYTSDASFVTIRGEHIVGNAAIGAGHDGIFHSIYAGSVNHIELVRADEILDGVVIAVSRNTLDVPVGPLAGRRQAFSTSVVVRDHEGAWEIRSTHNTLVAA